MTARTILFLAKPQALTAFYSQLKQAGIEAGLAETVRGALDFVAKKKPLLVFASCGLPGVRVEDLISAGQNDDSFPPIIVHTERGSAAEAQRFMEMGAHDYWLEPLVWEKIEAAIPSEPKPETKAAPSKPAAGQPNFSIIGDDPSVRRVLALAKQVAPSKASVLISGESGTGKEMFARYLHHHSGRLDKPFIAVNCAALPEHLLESELFGHEKGAFTGAITRKAGKFELAHGGTILLDEISEMDLGLQAKLLRVLQESEVDRVGGSETVKVDVRVLATTNRDIEESVKAKEFRQDLFFRLNVIPLKLPPLKNRGNDVMLLAQFFVNKYAQEYGLPKLAFSDNARNWLTGYDWPGNVRELQNLMERAVLLAGAGPIEECHFLIDSDSWPIPEELPDEAPAPVAAPAEGDENLGEAMSKDMPLSEIERIAILKRLEQTEGNRTQAAELLGISVRTLRNKIADYKKKGLEVP